MKSMIKSDVIVVGAGPVGLTAACELRLAGLRVVVLERRAAPVTQSRALTMHGRTLEMLALRGVADRFIAQGMKLPTGHYAGLGTRLDFSRIDTTYPFTLVIPQCTTEQLLEAWALELGVEVYRQTTVEHVLEDADGVQVRAVCADETRHFSAAYLIGADGARSAVRQHAGIAFNGTEPTQTVMMGDVYLRAPPPLRGFSMENAAGALMAVPLSADVWRMIVTDTQRMHVPAAVAVTLDELQASVQRVSGQDFDLHTPQWLSRFSNETRLAERYR
ncbi:MAG: FAD-dependent oxidoreductase, partial [Rhodanobacter sp.]